VKSLRILQLDFGQGQRELLVAAFEFHQHVAGRDPLPRLEIDGDDFAGRCRVQFDRL
jgi:hypothetical protein